MPSLGEVHATTATTRAPSLGRYLGQGNCDPGEAWRDCGLSRTSRLGPMRSGSQGRVALPVPALDSRPCVSAERASAANCGMEALSGLPFDVGLAVECGPSPSARRPIAGAVPAGGGACFGGNAPPARSDSNTFFFPYQRLRRRHVYPPRELQRKTLEGATNPRRYYLHLRGCGRIAAFCPRIGRAGGMGIARPSSVSAGISAFVRPCDDDMIRRAGSCASVWRQARSCCSRHKHRDPLGLTSRRLMSLSAIEWTTRPGDGPARIVVVIPWARRLSQANTVRKLPMAQTGRPGTISFNASCDSRL